VFKNGNSAGSPAGEVLRENYLKPLRMNANALAKVLRVPDAEIQQCQAHCAKSFTRCRLSSRPAAPYSGEIFPKLGRTRVLENRLASARKSHQTIN
jgi:hypothetical protein